MKYLRYSIVLLILSNVACLANIAFTTTGSEGGQITSSPDGWPVNYDNGYDDGAAYGIGKGRPTLSRDPALWAEYGPERSTTWNKLKDAVIKVQENVDKYRTELKQTSVQHIDNSIVKARTALKNAVYNNTRLKQVLFDLTTTWEQYGPVSIEPEDHSIFGIDGVNSSRLERKARRRTHAEE